MPEPLSMEEMHVGQRVIAKIQGHYISDTVVSLPVMLGTSMITLKKSGITWKTNEIFPDNKQTRTYLLLLKEEIITHL